MIITWLSATNPAFILQIKELLLQYGYVGVFLSMILAGSVIPFGSPIIVAYAAGFGLQILPLAFTAATGYTVGLLTSYIPAWFFGKHYIKKKMSEETFQNYVETWNRYGYKLCVLLSIIPGFPVDLLALVSGCFQMKMKWFLPICWVTLLIQFLLCGFIGQAIGIHILPQL